MTESREPAQSAIRNPQSATTGPLAGVRVLMQLSDMGAEVVKVEHPGLDEKQRGFGPYYEGISTFFFSPNRGKKGICVDIKTPEGVDLVRRLAREADIVAENFRPGVMERQGLGYESLRKENPRLIYAALSGFGQDGPYSQLPGVDVVAQAMGGTLALNGEAGGPPMRVGVSIGDMVGGLYLAIGMLGALQARERTGEGQFLDVALMEAQVALCENAIVRKSAFGENITRQGSRHPLMAPFGVYETADGFVVIGNVKDWPLFCGLIDADELALDPRFASNRARIDHVEELEVGMNAALARKTTAEWFAILEAANCCAIGKVNEVADLFDDPHIAARGMLVDLPLPYDVPGTLTLPNSPIHLSETPTVVGNFPMPAHGQHTGDILRSWLSMDPTEIDELRAGGIVK